MNWLNHITSLKNPLELISFYLSHVLSAQVQIVFIDVILILAIHGLFIFILMRVFKRFVINTALGRNKWMSFVSYFLAISLIMFGHFNDILMLSIVLDSLHVFPDPLTTFYYVSGMYTTIGSDSNPGPQWQSLSMVISFAGLFAFSISGAGLYTMLGFFMSAREHEKKS